VLALILQTHQLHTASRRPNGKQLVGASYTEESDIAHDDTLFQTYWSEQVVVDFRRPALLKVVNDFSKKIVDIGFFPLNAIQKAIMDDKFGGDFCSFQRCMEYVLTAN
jgi:hypothetical protein